MMAAVRFVIQSADAFTPKAEANVKTYLCCLSAQTFI